MSKARSVLVIDTGQGIVGIYSVRARRYRCYRGGDIAQAVRLIQEADEIVTYNGNHADLLDLGEFAGIGRVALPLNGKHTDMREVCWSNRIWGSNLHNTYLMHYQKLPSYKDTHEGCNRLDCVTTFKLWKLWKAGRLKVLDGNATQQRAPERRPRFARVPSPAARARRA